MFHNSGLWRFTYTNQPIFSFLVIFSIFSPWLHFCRPKGAKRLPAGEARSALAGPFDYTVYPLYIDEPMVDSTQPKWKIPGVMNVKIAVKL